MSDLPHPDEVDKVVRPIGSGGGKKCCGPKGRKYGCIFFILTVVVLTLVTTHQRVKKNKKSGSGSRDKGLPELERAPTICTDGDKCANGPDYQLFKDYIVSSLELENIYVVLDDETSVPQYLAFDWLWKSFNYEKDYDHILQRYAMACLYYATYNVANKQVTDPSGWDVSTDWLSGAHECTWYGVMCRDDKVVTGINLNNNYLSGHVPIELKLIGSTLKALDIGSNFIHMDEAMFSVFTGLTQLNTLRMDDNFIELTNGLPMEMGMLSKLQTLRLSNNPISGPLRGNIVKKWSRLNQISIENCQLTGTLPRELGDLTRLQYAVFRNNNLSSHLKFIEKVNKDNQFATIWLDSNNIYGKIPTEIGLFSNLESFSITNASLVGTIPTEMGALQTAYKIWLYRNNLSGQIPKELANIKTLEVLELKRNDLTGSMPEEICERISSAKERRNDAKVTADCNELVCNCCANCKSASE